MQYLKCLFKEKAWCYWHECCQYCVFSRSRAHILMYRHVCRQTCVCVSVVSKPLRSLCLQSSFSSFFFFFLFLTDMYVCIAFTPVFINLENHKCQASRFTFLSPPPLFIVFFLFVFLYLNSHASKTWIYVSKILLHLRDERHHWITSTR